METTMALVVVVFFYFIPTICSLGGRRTAAILVLNALLGWTLVGWIAALVWALAEDRIPCKGTRIRRNSP